jgi:hypothetical protein
MVKTIEHRGDLVDLVAASQEAAPIGLGARARSVPL